MCRIRKGMSYFLNNLKIIIKFYIVNKKIEKELNWWIQTLGS